MRNSALRVLDAHPVPTLVVDSGVRVVYANGLAKRRFGVKEGLKLGEALHCADAKDDACGTNERCSGCAFRRGASRALAGTPSVERGFVLRGEAPGDPEDLHLLAAASPFERDGNAYAILALTDLNAILGDPGIVQVCEGCGKIQDEEGAWHPLHRYLDDRLGLETAGGLCDDCHAGTSHGSRARETEAEPRPPGARSRRP